MTITLDLPEHFVRAYPPQRAPAGEALWLIFADDDRVICSDSSAHAFPRGRHDLDVESSLLDGEIFLGVLHDRPCMGATLPAGTTLPAGWTTLDLRSLFDHLPGELFAVVGYAYQIVRWQRAARFCAFCGSATEPVDGEWGKRCTSCNHVAYPHVSPCVIALIHDGEGRILLAHRRGRGPMMSLVAGFLEPGESLEGALRREVREEVGLEVDQIRYFASQPWPFPHQLMVGFFARHAGGEPRPDGDELDHAAWYTLEDLGRVVLPGPISIARRLIDAFAAQGRSLPGGRRNE